MKPIYLPSLLYVLSKVSKTIRLILFCLCFGLSSFGQQKIDEAIEKYNDHSVAYISTDELIQLQKENSPIYVLDTRSIEEYDVSHIKNAIHVDYKNFNIKSIQKSIQKSDLLIVYCSIGVRSEQIGKQLQKAGYPHVFNLYGGVFRWKNEGKTIFNKQIQETDSIHAYDQKWGELIEKGIKIYD